MKIFGIGLSRTGTTSLHLALIALGKASVHYPDFAVSKWLHGNFCQDNLSDFDACSDIPAAIYFRELDQRYPGSKFILTIRDEDSWIKSTRNWWGKCPPSNQYTRLRDMVRLAAYGSIAHNDDRFLNRYREHFLNVKDYFSLRPNQLLVLDLRDVDKWEKLSMFLGLPKPNINYPNMKSPRLGYLKEVRRKDLLDKRKKLLMTLQVKS
jgi:hypothetical protein